jgi:flagellum-specific ATP synthase
MSYAVAAEKDPTLPLAERLAAASAAFRAMPAMQLAGRIGAVTGLAVEVEGVTGFLSVGDRLVATARDGRDVALEVIGFRAGRAQAMALGDLAGLGPGMPARIGGEASFSVSHAWLGRVIDPLGNPLDGKGPLVPGRVPRPVRGAPPPATSRSRLGPRLPMGVRALDLFAGCRQGQRLGLFAGSGVGKSTLMAMLARQADCDVAVIALVGERGREVREFIEDDLGEAGLARSVVVVATSDAAPLLRREAAHAALAVAEHFRDEGLSVLLMMDSVTRFCLAAREIGLSAGEPPATRGYPPSVFAELPRLLERAGPGLEGKGGSITALFTVLVEGEDHDEPVADAARGILDGHVVLERRIAESGRFPAVNVLRSLSRAAPGILSPQEKALLSRARRLLALHADMADMVRLGAYRPGSDPEVDEAVRLAPRIEALLAQDKDEAESPEAAFAALAAILDGGDGA